MQQRRGPVAAAEAMGTIVSACVWLLGLLRAQAGRLGGLLPLPPIHLVWGRCAVQQAGHASVRHILGLRCLLLDPKEWAHDP